MEKRHARRHRMSRTFIAKSPKSALRSAMASTSPQPVIRSMFTHVSNRIVVRGKKTSSLDLVVMVKSTR